MISELLVDQQRYPLTEASGRSYHQQFRDNCYVCLPSFYRPEAFALLCDEVERLRLSATRRDLQMAETDNTPRRMYTVGGDKVVEYSTIIPSLYRDERLLAFLSGVAGEEVFEVPDPVENHNVNVLDQVGDVHGGHVDTYAFSFNVLMEAVPEGSGGALQFVPGSTSVEDLEGPGARSVHHPVGHCYFLKTDGAVHRVSPLTRPGRRVVLNMAYANPATVNLRSYSTGALYGDS